MLRSIPATPLVCVVLCLTLIAIAPAWAEEPDRSLEILLKPNTGASSSSSGSAVSTRSGRGSRAPARRSYAPFPGYGGPSGITKVKPARGSIPCGYPALCFLPRPQPGQWEMSTQVLFGRVGGTIAWPRYRTFSTNWDQEVDFSGDLGIPEHQAFVQFTARYQFRPSWAFRYTVLAAELSGSGTPDGQFYFGPNNFTIGFGQRINTKWEHAYHRVGLVYDAINTCRSKVSVYADWVHMEDKMNVNCDVCGNYSTVFSRGGDSAIAGLEIQRCIKTLPNGGTFSWDHKAGFIFYDNAEGWDLETGIRYSVPLNCGRAGYAKAGYRFIDYKKGQEDLLLEYSIEGGFVEFGLIF